MAADNTQTAQEKRKEAQTNRRMMQLVTTILWQKSTNTKLLSEYYPGTRARLERELQLARSLNLIMGRRGEHMVTIEGRKLALVSWIGRQGAATQQNMIDRFELDRLVIEKSLQEAFNDRLLSLVGTLRREDELYMATRAGMAGTWLTYMRECRVSHLQEAHLRACVTQAIRLELEYGPAYRVMSEREVLAENGRKKGSDCLASPEYFYRGVMQKTPDLVVVLEGPNGEFLEVIAIEVELSAKNDRERHAIIRAYRGFTGVDAVVYLTAPNIVGHLEWTLGRVNLEIAELIKAGKLKETDTRPITITQLRSSEVPAMRRLEYYEPITIKGASERFDAIEQTAGYKTVQEKLLDLMEWIGYSGVVGIDAVATYFGLDEKQAYERLLLAHGAEWLKCTEMLYAEGKVFFATRAGLEAVGLNPAQYLINYKSSSHYRLTGMLCMRARVHAHLYREPELAAWSIKGQWKLRGERIFNGIPVLNISAGREKSVGEHKSPDLILTNNIDPQALMRVVLIYPSLLQIDKVKFALEMWMAYPGIGFIYLYIGEEKVLESAKRLVEGLKVEDRVSVRPLPISETERALIARRSAVRL